MPSIRLRLLKWLIAPILLINLAGGALTYMLAWLPAQTAFDQSLSDAAGALGARLSAANGAWRIDLPPQAEQVLRNGDADAVYFVVRDSAGRVVAGDADFPALRQAGGAALAYDGAMRGEAVRVGTLRVAAAGGAAAPAYVGVARTLRQRTQVRQAIFRALVLLDGLFTLACVGLIWFSVTNGLRPLDRMRAGLNARAGDQLAPIQQEDVPYELAPVVHAFNGLLARVSEGAQAQQDFLANVAHQLRTPLAGLQTQLEWLGNRHAEPDTAHSIRLMQLSTERMIRQTNQLLALARAEPSHFEKTRLEPLALDALVEETVQHFVEQAARKAIDIGFELQHASVLGDRFLLRDLIDNLVDNAIRYTPAHGTVTVRCRPGEEGGGALTGGTVLEVEDSGPGIAPALREAVFRRYVRLDDTIAGSGLGLAIVRDIAAAHGARIAVASPAGGQGALFSVRFPVHQLRP
ncbi:histidine kinase [Massilia sp. Root351]|uniref:sensor histidine kinase n=1 Tax=Massilia sp. Root351 TaxID=1736522 RepID=UPI00070EE63E|nr:sensor histidine kinase [Massilia sp. Root351]KQV80781.1 histidine kinase [Massilia sp. Root351]